MGATTRFQMAWGSKLRWLSLTPFDQGTAEGRANERHRRVALTAAAATLAKMLAIGSTLVSVPLTLNYLGPERFGMWMTIGSLIAILAFADLGIGNGVLNAVAKAQGEDDADGVRRTVSNGFFLLSCIGAGLLAVFLVCYPWVPWYGVFNVHSDIARAEAGPALLAFVLCFAASIPLSVVQRTQLGLQQGFAANVWQCVGGAGALLGIVVAVHLQAGLPWLVLALAGAPLLALLGNTLHFFLVTRPDLRPRLAALSNDTGRALVRMGLMFFVLQLVAAVAYASDTLLIAQLLGAPAVADYAVTEKLFSVVTMVVTLALAPFWPAYGEASSRGDAAWVRRTLRSTLLLAVGVAGLAAVAILLLAPQLLALWIGKQLHPEAMLLAAFALWKTIEAGGIALAMYLNGTQVITLQLWCAVPTAGAAVLLKLLFIPQIGTAGAPLATAAAYMLCTLVPVALLMPRLLRRPLTSTPRSKA